MRLIAAGAALALLSLSLFPANAGADDDRRGAIRPVIDGIVPALMQRQGIPGMAVGIVTPHGSEIFNFGVMSVSSGRPVTADTLFEIGSISKTFTATLASYAAIGGHLALTDTPGRYLPALRGSRLDQVSLLNLGTHTAGGFPLQFPDAVQDDEQAMQYFANWTPQTPPGTSRTYANPSVALLGAAVAASLGEDFDTLMAQRIFPMLGLQHTYLHVPAQQIANYAQGYSSSDAPIRLSAGALASPIYGVRTTASDLLRFVAANMAMVPLDPALQRAVTATHTGYDQLGAMTQDLIWEQYRMPVALPDLLAGNSADVIFKPQPVVAIAPPAPARDDVLINKTGSTNGFGAYLAFHPAARTGIVLLANKNYPIEARVTAAYQILQEVEAKLSAAPPPPSPQ